MSRREGGASGRNIRSPKLGRSLMCLRFSEEARVTGAQETRVQDTVGLKKELGLFSA